MWLVANCHTPFTFTFALRRQWRDSAVTTEVAEGREERKMGGERVAREIAAANLAVPPVHAYI